MYDVFGYDAAGVLWELRSFLWWREMVEWVTPFLPNFKQVWYQRDGGKVVWLKY